MKPIKLSADLFDTFEDNVETLNEILKYWCDEDLSYDRFESSIKIDLDVLKSILYKLNTISNIKSYSPGRTTIDWDENHRTLEMNAQHNYLVDLDSDNKQLRSVTYFLYSYWSLSHDHLLPQYRYDIVPRDRISSDFYIIEWKDLATSLIKHSLESALAHTEIISEQELEDLSREYPAFSDIFTKIPIFHESFLELSDLKRFVLYRRSQNDSSSINTITFHWQVLDFSRPMILDCSVEEETNKLLIPSMGFTVYFLL